jgi:hypothetical protein
MTIEEWSQAPIILFGQPLQPLVVLEHILNHQRVNVLSRDFVGHMLAPHALFVGLGIV